MTQSLKQILKVATFVLATVSATSQAYRIPLYTEFNPKFQLDGNKNLFDSYLNWAFKLNDNYSFVVETRNDLVFKAVSGGKETSRIDHKYVRVFLSQPKIAEFGSWVFGMDYRWRIPTAASMQTAGSFGGFAVRPYLNAKFGIASIQIRDVFEVFANKTQLPGGDPTASAGNTIFHNLIELNTSFEVAPGLNIAPMFSYDAARSWHVAGMKTDWAQEFWQEWEINYTHPRYTLNTTVGASIENTADISSGQDQALFKKKETSFNIKIYRVF